jgi:hypothetical protein
MQFTFLTGLIFRLSQVQTLSVMIRTPDASDCGRGDKRLCPLLSVGAGSNATFKTAVTTFQPPGHSRGASARSRRSP